LKAFYKYIGTVSFFLDLLAYIKIKTKELIQLKIEYVIELSFHNKQLIFSLRASCALENEMCLCVTYTKSGSKICSGGFDTIKMHGGFSIK